MSGKATIERVDNGWIVHDKRSYQDKVLVFKDLKDALECVAKIVEKPSGKWIEEVVVRYKDL